MDELADLLSGLSVDEISKKSINTRILNEICDETINSLQDINLLDEYMNCKSVKNKINKLDNILLKYNISTSNRNDIIKDFMNDLVPAGTKGVIKGNKFNNIVKNYITELKLDETKFDIQFEKKCESCSTNEIPDWYILEKSSKKVIIGMNQLDLWNGGQQLNRGSYYLIDNKANTKNSKLLCVICNKIIFLTRKNKAFNLFNVGYKNDTLCYLKNLRSIIEKYFDIKNL